MRTLSDLMAKIYLVLAVWDDALRIAVATEVAAHSAPRVERVAPAAQATPGRPGRVRIDDHSLVDDDGPFLGLGVSYFTALWRSKHDPARLGADFEFLARQGFNYYRMLSMVGHHPVQSASS